MYMNVTYDLGIAFTHKVHYLLPSLSSSRNMNALHLQEMECLLFPLTEHTWKDRACLDPSVGPFHN